MSFKWSLPFACSASLADSLRMNDLDFGSLTFLKVSQTVQELLKVYRDPAALSLSFVRFHQMVITNDVYSLFFLLIFNDRGLVPFWIPGTVPYLRYDCVVTFISSALLLSSSIRSGEDEIPTAFLYQHLRGNSGRFGSCRSGDVARQ